MGIEVDAATAATVATAATAAVERDPVDVDVELALAAFDTAVALGDSILNAADEQIMLDAAYAAVETRDTLLIEHNRHRAAARAAYYSKK